MLGSADELLAQVIEKDLQGMALSAELTRVLMGLRLHGKNSLAVWLLEFFLAQRGFSLKGIYNMQHDMSNLSSTERLALRSLLFEFTINAFYSTPMYKALGFLISDMLLFDRHVDAGTKAFLSSNIVHFVPILAFERFFSINTDMPFITPATGLRYKPSNPSVLQTADGYLILIRGVNCAHDGRSWWSLADDGVFRSRYIVLLADRELNVLARHELTLAHVKRPVLSRRRPNEGVEDARLVMLDGQVWFTASAYDQSEHGTIRIVLCRLALAPDAAGELPVLSWTALDGPDPLRAEKNWLPFVHEGALHAFYSLGPETIALRLHADSGKFDPVRRSTSAFDLSRFRGSAGPLPFEVGGQPGLLCIVHEVSFDTSERRIYTHRFVWLDNAWAVRRVSHIFYFDRVGVEYCCGMAAAHDAAELLLTVGVDEGVAARLYGVTAATVRGMLHDIPSLPAP